MPKKIPANNNSIAHADVEQNFGNAPLRTEEVARFASPVHLHFHHVRQRLADLDGLSIKAVLDGLVAAGVLADDSPKQVAAITHSQTKGRDEKTIVTITTD